jgi:tRNA threonylcarbamoyladenosine biosynthesis protein TsaE
MSVFTTRSVAETEAFGEQLGGAARAGDVLGLSGDLGAGKTALVRGFARGLGFVGRVHSPTFALLNEYAGGRLPLFHLDLYRLESPDAIHATGLEEYLMNPSGVSVVEWIERWSGEPTARPTRLRRVQLRVLDEFSREITYDDPRA